MRDKRGVDGGRPEGPEPPLVRGRTSSGVELIGLGVFLAAALVLPLIGGLELDHLLHTNPLGLGAGLLVGIVACCAGVYVRYREV